MVERLLAKEEVARSTLVFRSPSLRWAPLRWRDGNLRARLGGRDPATPRPKWRNGRRDGLKNRWGQPRVGSSPTFGTSFSDSAVARMSARPPNLRPTGTGRELAAPSQVPQPRRGSPRPAGAEPSRSRSARAALYASSVSAESSPDHFAANAAHWDERVRIHVASRFYDVDGFRAGRDTLQLFEREEVGPVAGKSLVHLQCHFGMDTLSWARSGARVTGLDFSQPAIEQARALARDLGIEAEFVVANVYDAVAALGGRQFDIVYVGMGSLVWLPDVSRWARVAAALVRPGGVLYLTDGHPFIDMLASDTLTLVDSYFASQPQMYDEPGTYADLQAATHNNRAYEWVHPIGETVTALLRAGLRLEFLHERDYALFQRWPFLEYHPEDRTYRMPGGMPSVPMMYSLRATKPL